MIFTMPRQHYIVLLDGGIQTGTSSGDTENFATGKVILVKILTAKDTHQNLDPKTRRSVFREIFFGIY